MDITEIEKAHTFALKKLLNVAPRTPNDMVYGETGRVPLSIDAKSNAIRYWIRLTRMEDSRLPKKAYNMLIQLDRLNQRCWVTDIRRLALHGFGYVWLNGGVQNVRGFLRQFKQRLIDCWKQEWSSRIQEHERYAIYRTFKFDHSLEPYFEYIKNKSLRDVFVRLRLGITDMLTHKFRYSSCSHSDLLCPLCKSHNDDEYHLFCCKVSEKLRLQYLPAELIHTTNQQLSTLNSKKHMNKIARYIYYCFKLRSAEQ